MKVTRIVFVLCALLGGTAAEAQLLRAFVSVSGLDTNPCTRQQPCRSFGAAIAAVSSGGEVIPLETGGYGPFVIDKSVAVSSPSGIHAAISASSGTAIDVQAGAGGRVILRGVYLNAQGATTGIAFSSGEFLHVESCVVHDFGSRNLRVERTVAFQPAEIIVARSAFRHRAASGNGMELLSTVESSKIEATVFESSFESHSTAIRVDGRVSLALADSLLSTNSFGVFVSGASGVFATDAAILRTHIVNGIADGVRSEADGSTVNVYLSGNTIVGNLANGVVEGAGTIVRTMQNNTIHGNGVDVAGTLSVHAPF